MKHWMSPASTYMKKWKWKQNGLMFVKLNNLIDLTLTYSNNKSVDKFYYHFLWKKGF